jgi:putative oxidoreductase
MRTKSRFLMFIINKNKLKIEYLMIYNFLFPTKPNTTKTSLLLLVVRIIFGVLLMNHGIQKWSNFQELSAVFPDPLGLGSPISLGLAIFGELVCSMAFIIGFLYRLAMIPMIFTMIVAFFIVHANDAFAVKELAFIYLIVFIIMYIAGPGKFSIDHIIGNEMVRRKLKS